ncbi:hypothetical protein ACQWFR_24895, partial [Salmonella enterica subsp. enterica serovar Infantis]
PLQLCPHRSQVRFHQFKFLRARLESVREAPDFNALPRLATVWNIPFANNVSTAANIIQSPNFNDAVDILNPDYARYMA